VGLYELHVQLKLWAVTFCSEKRKEQENIYKGRKEDMCNPTKIEGDAEEKIFESIKDYKVPPYSLGGYCHRKHLTHIQ
jgi:hypothetical protein